MRHFALLASILGQLVGPVDRYVRQFIDLMMSAKLNKFPDKTHQITSLDFYSSSHTRLPPLPPPLPTYAHSATAAGLIAPHRGKDLVNLLVDAKKKAEIKAKCTHT